MAETPYIKEYTEIVDKFVTLYTDYEHNWKNGLSYYKASNSPEPIKTIIIDII